MTNNQTKSGIIYENIAMWAADDERMINYEWPNFYAGKTAFLSYLSLGNINTTMLFFIDARKEGTRLIDCINNTVALISYFHNNSAFNYWYF